MTRLFALITLLLPLNCLAQFTITGKVLNKADKKPVENVSVFLSNATIGDKTAPDGSFTLRNVKPGKYDLVVTDIAFETFSQPLVVENNVKLPDIVLAQQVRSLGQVTVKYHADPDRSKYLEWFKDAFIGISARAKDCSLVNPEMLDLRYDKERHLLTASSVDFLVVENAALGYRVKYLLTDFWMRDSLSHQQLRYKGYSLFEEMKGSAGQQARWQRARENVYANSPMHFFRAAIADKLDENNFRVQKLADIPNPERPADSLLATRIAYFKSSAHNNRDSLAFWTRKEKLPRTFRKLLPDALHKRDIITRAGGRNLYTLYCNNCNLVVGYNQSHHFHIDDHIEYFYNRGNTDNTFIQFNLPQVPVYAMGVLSDPFDLGYEGVWGRNRMAELLPLDYEPAISMENTAGQDLVLARLDSFSSAHPAEKAYLQFDKPYYAAGDTMYFKAYVTMGERHVPSQISGILHVDLVNTKDKTDQSIKLQLAGGIAWGDFALPDSLPKGNYRVRAWTQWMRNDPGSFFEKAIAVGSLQNGKVPGKITAKTIIGKPDVQFFPEGGTWVAGISSRMAFKAIGPNGLGIPVSGVVIDNDNKEIATFSSAHLGLGSLALTPVFNKTYHAKLTFADGSTQIVDLPKAEEKGISLAVNNDSIPVVKVRITANDAYFAENKAKSYSLLIYSGGTATTVDCTLDSAITTFDILKRKLFTGVTTITLFSPQNEPLCERLIFVQNYDQLSLNLKTDKQQYAPREKVTLKLNVKTRADSAATGHFSIAVTDESKVSNNENSETTILSHLLLTSDLKGYIEQPNYYFNHITDTTAKNLDLVMLTHGYRKFQWQQVLSSSQEPPAYKPENDLSITGTVKNLQGKPVANGTVSLIPPNGGRLLSTTTDDKGGFKFSNLLFTDTAKFVLQAVTDKGKNSTVITWNKLPGSPAVAPQPVLTPDTGIDMTSYLQNHKEQWDQYAKYGSPAGRLLKEVKIKALRSKDNYPSSSLAGPGHADQVVHANEIENRGGSLSDRLNGKLIGVRFDNKIMGPGGIPYLGPASKTPMLIIIDGVEMMGNNSINVINPNSVETVEVLRLTSTSIYGSEGGDGVIIITTKQGKGLDPKDIASKGILPIAMPGFYKGRQFYAPKYEHPGDNPNRKDLRSSIYWQPELATDAGGHAEISFYNADGNGNYKVVVEGMDGKGNIGRAVYRYVVN